MSEHIVSSFDEELNGISDGIITMGALVLEALKRVETTLKNNDHNLAQEIIDADSQINELGQSVENKVFNILRALKCILDILTLLFLMNY